MNDRYWLGVALGTLLGAALLNWWLLERDRQQRLIKCAAYAAACEVFNDHMKDAHAAADPAPASAST